MARTSDGGGYWLVRSHGVVSSYGDAPVNASKPLPPAPIVSIAAIPGTNGYFLLGEDGVVVAEGATSGGSTSAGVHCNAVSVAVTSDGGGGWILLSTGKVLTFGDAVSYGSGTGYSGTTFVDLTPTPDGKGYWLLGKNGQVVPGGDATAWCNLYQINPNGFSVDGLAPVPDNQGFWIGGSPPKYNGGLAACGDAQFLGAPNPAPTTPFVAIASMPSGQGYWLLDRTGTVFPFGNALDYPLVGSN